jgi:hypothetical protein
MIDESEMQGRFCPTIDVGSCGFPLMGYQQLVIFPACPDYTTLLTTVSPGHFLGGATHLRCYSDETASMRSRLACCCSAQGGPGRRRDPEPHWRGWRQPRGQPCICAGSGPACQCACPPSGWRQQRWRLWTRSTRLRQKQGRPRC